MRKMMTAVALLAAALCAPAFVLAAGIPNATVSLVYVSPLLAVTVPVSPPTDADGGFLFDGLVEGNWQLVVATPAPLRNAVLDFEVPVEKAPARLAGRVTTLDGADVSLQVNAMITPAGTGSIVLAPGYPRIQPAWNRNWARANGQLHVRLKGTGLEGLEKVVLTRVDPLTKLPVAPPAFIETTKIVRDPVSGVYHAIFPKKAAFTALAASAVRGEVIEIAVGLTTPGVTEAFGASFRVVGSKKPHPLH